MPTDGTQNAKIERRLAAVLAADIAGYSALMGANEEATVRDLKAHQSVILPMIKEHGGRVIDTAGDGVLAEFASIVKAVVCAVAVQETMAERNASIEQARRMHFRMGINLGDVICDETRIYGDGINIAARLESIARPGGICVSSKVFDEVHGKVDIHFKDIGERILKNISQPVRIYQVEPRSELQVFPKKPALPSSSEKPSIAVLPFNSLSEDRSLELIADGLVEDVIALLARVPGFFVIARSSSFAYRNRTQDIRVLGRELGVRYIVEGSIRATDKRARISIQLVEAESGKQLWTQRFDVQLAATFDLQDQIAHRIIRQLEPELTRAELTAIERQRPDNLDAWSRYRQALGVITLSGWNEKALAQAIAHLRGAIMLDPHFALAYAMLALLVAISANLSFAQDRSAAHRQALQDAETAVTLDPNASEVLGYAGCALADIGELPRGRELLERAIEIDPSNAQAYVALGAVQVQVREFDAGIKAMQHGIRLSPRDVKLPFWRMILAAGLARSDRLEEALAEALKSCQRDGRLYGARVVAAFVHLRLGRDPEARAALTEARRIRPALSIEEIQRFFGRFIAQDLAAIGDVIAPTLPPERMRARRDG
jgi:adenylate cyclase